MQIDRETAALEFCNILDLPAQERRNILYGSISSEALDKAVRMIESLEWRIKQMGFVRSEKVICGKKKEVAAV